MPPRSRPPARGDSRLHHGGIRERAKAAPAFLLTKYSGVRDATRGRARAARVAPSAMVSATVTLRSAVKSTKVSSRSPPAVQRARVMRGNAARHCSAFQHALGAAQRGRDALQHGGDVAAARLGRRRRSRRAARRRRRRRTFAARGRDSGAVDVAAQSVARRRCLRRRRRGTSGRRSRRLGAAAVLRGDANLLQRPRRDAVGDAKRVAGAARALSQPPDARAAEAARRAAPPSAKTPSVSPRAPGPRRAPPPAQPRRARSPPGLAAAPRVDDAGVLVRQRGARRSTRARRSASARSAPSRVRILPASRVAASPVSAMRRLRSPRAAVRGVRALRRDFARVAQGPAHLLQRRLGAVQRGRDQTLRGEPPMRVFLLRRELALLEHLCPRRAARRVRGVARRRQPEQRRLRGLHLAAQRLYVARRPCERVVEVVGMGSNASITGAVRKTSRARLHDGRRRRRRQDVVARLLRRRFLASMKLTSRAWKN